MEFPETQSENIYEEYGNENAESVKGKVFKDVKVDGTHDVNKDKKENEGEVNEGYDQNYEAYNPHYADYSKPLNSHRNIIFEFAKKKWVILLVIALLAICGLVVGLSVHFTMAQGFFNLTSHTESVLLTIWRIF